MDSKVGISADESTQSLSKFGVIFSFCTMSQKKKKEKKSSIPKLKKRKSVSFFFFSQNQLGLFFFQIVFCFVKGPLY